MSKLIGNDKTIDGILEGMSKVAEVVGSTYGPKGRNVVIEDEEGRPHITKDGVTVAKSVEFSRPDWNIGASLIKDAAIKTLKEVGDGTTTTTILANLASQISVGAIKSQSLNPFELRTYLEKYVNKVIDYLKSISTPIQPSDRETLMKVALNSANGDVDIAEKVTDLFTQIGKDGIVFVKNSEILGVHTQVIKGISIDRGYVSPIFCVNGQSSITLDNCKILIARRVIRDYKEIIPYLQEAKNEDRPILLIVPEVDNTVVELFLTNVLSGVIQGCVIQAPYSNERQDDFFQDLGIASGAVKNDKDLSAPYLVGNAEKVIVGRYDTEFRGLSHDEMVYKRHLAFLEDLVQTQTDRTLAEKASERLAMFAGSIGYIHVGASSEAESLEIKDKLDDVIHAVKAALKEGVVPAGGVALDNAAHFLGFSSRLTEEKAKHAGPAITIKVNEKEAALVIIQELCRAPKKFIGETSTSTQDPTKVVYTALKNAISVAGLLFTSKYVILDERQSEYTAFE